jgi:hypothetical protein
MTASRGVVYEVEGGREFRKTLKKAGDDLSDLKETHRTVAGIVVPVAQRMAPKRSGRLAGSIRPAGTKSAAIVRAGSRAVPYANVIQWGWPARNIVAQPFLTDAAKATEPVWTRVYEAETQRILNKVKGA